MLLSEIGITSVKAGQFARRDIHSVEDLLRFYPVAYRDYRTIVPIGELASHNGDKVCVRGTVDGCRVIQGKHTVISLVDGTGNCKVMFFNRPYMARNVLSGKPYLAGGQVTWNARYMDCTIASPDYFELAERNAKGTILPMYRKIPRMSDDYLRDAIHEGLRYVDDCHCEYLSASERAVLGVKDFAVSARYAHSPKNSEEIALAQRRQIVDELYPFCAELEDKKRKARLLSPFIPEHADQTLSAVLSKLQFRLTDDQEKAVQTIVGKMKSGTRVDALVQGDVGCGKTIIAVLAAAVMAQSGIQTAVMCPTTVLAKQHVEEFHKYLDGFGANIVYLHGGLKAGERRAALESVRSGRASVVIGTHSIFSTEVAFHKLGLVVIDEEHRFGVKQREFLKEKAADGVHSISMSATPIPRSLAVTVYGEGTEIINIHTKPAGRKDVMTILYSNELKVYQSIYNQIKQGHQCYVICPLIEESDSEGMEGVDSVELTYTKMSAWFSQHPEVAIEAIYGSMKTEDIQSAIDRFAAGKVHILISTTIVEVGVNVPNATVMLVKNAERFGLAQLHQLRGRVGRSELQSYCVLLSKDWNNERLKTLVKTNDGFVVAQKDLELRGTGQLLGVKQSGQDHYIDLMLANREIYDSIRKILAAK